MTGPATREATDPTLAQIRSALAGYQSAHPQARVDSYRQTSVTVRVRVIDPEFAGLSVRQRIDRVWDHLASLPEEVQEDVTLILPLTPAEVAGSGANDDFEHPIPSDL